ncbi:MAG: hypothetical protein J6N76_04065, partial [Lachnospiraceae bacterium]|nr:hypothetical protein [Lachnospiraceae bacterium]
AKESDPLFDSIKNIRVDIEKVTFSETGQYSETYEAVENAIKSGLTIEKISLEDYKALEETNLYAARMLLHEYIIRKSTAQPIMGIYGNHKTLKEKRGKITYTNKTDGKYAIVDYQELNFVTNDYYNKVNRYAVYPDPRTVNSRYSIANGVDSYGNTSGLTCCANMIDLLYGKRMISADQLIVSAKQMGVMEVKKEFERNKRGDIEKDETGKEKYSGYEDFKNTGWVSADNMQELLKSYGVNSNVYPVSDEGHSGIDAIIGHIMDGKAVTVSVSEKLLLNNGEGDYFLDEEPVLKSDYYVQILGVYKEQGQDEIKGFVVKDARENGVDYMTMEEFKKVYYGTEDQRVEGGSIIVAEKSGIFKTEEKK